MASFKTNQLKYFFVFLLLLPNCTSPKLDDVIAKVAGEPILVKDMIQAYYRESEKLDGEILKNKKNLLKFKEDLLEDLIQKKILTFEAYKAGIDVTEQELEKEIRNYKSRYTEKDFQKILEEKKIDYLTWREIKRVNLIIDRFMREKIFTTIKISEEEMKKYYEAHLEEFTEPESVHVRQIVTDSKEKADAILKRLKAGENFAKLARDLSIAPDRKAGGDLGFIFRGSFPKEFEICFSLKEGELSEVVSSLYGFHIFKVIEKKSEKKIIFEEAKEQIEEWLKEDQQESVFQQYYQKVKNQYPIEINSSVLKKVVFP